MQQPSCFATCSIVQPVVLEHNGRNTIAEYTQSLHRNGVEIRNKFDMNVNS